MSHIRFASFDISSVRLALSLQPRKNQESRRPLLILTDSQPAVSGFGRGKPDGFSLPRPVGVFSALLLFCYGAVDCVFTIPAQRR